MSINKPEDRRSDGNRRTHGNRRSLGLTLGGGGARGLAHIGVLKVLDQEEITVDYLSGASMGGLLGALYAAGWPPDEMEREALRMSRASNLIRLIDLTPARRGLLEGSQVRNYLEKLLGSGRTFNDLRIPLSLAAVDLNTGLQVSLCEGPLVEAVLATIAVPGLFPPVARERQLLVDGGLLDNVPIDILRTMGAQLTVAVDVTPDIFGEHNLAGETSRQDWPALLPPFARDLYLAELILTSTITRARLESSPPDLLLHPDIPPSVSIFWGLKHASEAIAAGAEAARQALPELRSRLR